jgi:hypothetical protein
MTVDQRRVRVFALNLAAFPDLSVTLRIKGVPVVFVGSHRFDSALPEAMLAQQIRLAGGPPLS